MKKFGSKIEGFVERSVALVILILLGPIILIVLEVVFLITGDSPVFKQKRGLVLEGELIDIYKIRTIKKTYRDEIESKTSNIFYKNEYFPNISPFCAFLRKTGFDEILQLINVIMGEMSIIGPRPLMLSDLKLIKENYTEYYERRKKISLKPGITGYWQIYGKREAGISNLIEHEEFYEKNKSLKLNILLVLKTLKIIFTAGHSDSIVKDMKEYSLRKYPKTQNSKF